MQLTYEGNLDISEVIEASNNVSKELNSIIELCEARIIAIRGYADGKGAGSWVFDGNTPAETVLLTQAGIKNGDAAVLDQLPQPRLGGEFADDPTWEDILRDEIHWDDEETNERSDLRIAYEDAFYQGVQDEVLSYSGADPEYEEGAPMYIGSEMVYIDTVDVDGDTEFCRVRRQDETRSFVVVRDWLRFPTS